MALKTDVGGPYISLAAAGKEPQVIQVQREHLPLEAMGEAFCMSVCLLLPGTQKGPLPPNDRYNAEVSPSILPRAHSCDPALLGHSARTLGCNGPTGVDISMTDLARRSPEAGAFFRELLPCLCLLDVNPEAQYSHVRFSSQRRGTKYLGAACRASPSLNCRTVLSSPDIELSRYFWNGRTE